METTVPTIIRYGTKALAQVSFKNGTSEVVDTSALPEYVSEARNPENQKGVLAVDVFLPNELLAG